MHNPNRMEGTKSDGQGGERHNSTTHPEYPHKGTFAPLPARTIMDRATRHTKFRGRILGLSVYEGEIEGRHVTREIIEHPGAAAVLPLDPDGMVIMVNQHRFPRGRVLEIPAGTLEEGESPRDCALRELTEETGYVAGSMEPLLSYYPSIGYNTEIIHCFVASNLKEAQSNPDEDEIISVERHTMPDLLEMIKAGRIQDSKTICALLAYQTYHS